MAIVVDPPRFDLLSRIVDRHVLRDVQALVAQATIERLYFTVQPSRRSITWLRW
jgi:hypothetical protein